MHPLQEAKELSGDKVTSPPIVINDRRLIVYKGSLRFGDQQGTYGTVYNGSLRLVIRGENIDGNKQRLFIFRNTRSVGRCPPYPIVVLSPNLTSVVFEPGSQFRSIEKESFSDCMALTNIDIPGSV
jgi:hypothetical protein